MILYILLGIALIGYTSLYYFIYYQSWITNSTSHISLSVKHTSIRWRFRTELFAAYFRIILKSVNINRSRKRYSEKDAEDAKKIFIECDFRFDKVHYDAYKSLVRSKLDRSGSSSNSSISDVIPPFYFNAVTGFLQVLLISHPQFRYAAVGSLNVSNKVTVHQSLTVRECIGSASFRAECKTTDVRDTRRGKEIDQLISVYRNGNLVWDCVFSMLVIGRSRITNTTSTTTTSTTSANNASSPEKKREEKTKTNKFESLIPESIQIPSAIGFDYAKLSYDCNPIHIHPLMARFFGFKSNIAHGLWVAAAVVEHIQARASGQRSSVAMAAEYHVQFKSPVLLPCVVDIHPFVREDHHVQDSEQSGKMTWKFEVKPNLEASPRGLYSAAKSRERPLIEGTIEIPEGERRGGGE